MIRSTRTGESPGHAAKTLDFTIETRPVSLHNIQIDPPPVIRWLGESEITMRELGDGEDVAIIVETTPRVRHQHSNWTTSRLKPWTANIGSKANASYNKQRVRVSGWLMLDPEHKDMIDEGLRSTLWEIHPIYKNRSLR